MNTQRAITKLPHALARASTLDPGGAPLTTLTGYLSLISIGMHFMRPEAAGSADPFPRQSLFSKVTRPRFGQLVDHRKKFAITKRESTYLRLFYPPQGRSPLHPQSRPQAIPKSSVLTGHRPNRSSLSTVVLVAPCPHACGTSWPFPNLTRLDKSQAPAMPGNALERFSLFWQGPESPGDLDPAFW